MRERLLDLCLLAYPRARRAPDREFLRDLALELAETHGFPRQAWSLLGGGLRERIELRRRRRPVRVRHAAKRIGVAASALAFAAAVLVAYGRGDENVSEVDEFVCEHADDRLSHGDAVPGARRSGCRETERLVAARERVGWDCTTRRLERPGELTTTWRCTRASNVVAWPRI
jgi:hypothetical protein